MGPGAPCLNSSVLLEDEQQYVYRGARLPSTKEKRRLHEMPTSGYWWTWALFSVVILQIIQMELSIRVRTWDLGLFGLRLLQGCRGVGVHLDPKSCYIYPLSGDQRY